MASAYVLINVELGAEEELLKTVRAIPGVIEAHRVFGIYDTVLKVQAETTSKLNEVITQRIRRLPRVRSTLTMIIIE
jgi:DNA-binding Lrp family transcriptional regulator